MGWPEWIVGGVLLLLVGVLGFAVYEVMTADSFTLFKADWACTRYETVTRPALVGKLLTSMRFEECVQWSRQ